MLLDLFICFEWTFGWTLLQFFLYIYTYFLFKIFFLKDVIVHCYWCFCLCSVRMIWVKRCLVDLVCCSCEDNQQGLLFVVQSFYSKVDVWCLMTSEREVKDFSCSCFLLMCEVWWPQNWKWRISAVHGIIDVWSLMISLLEVKDFSCSCFLLMCEVWWPQTWKWRISAVHGIIDM